MRNKLLESLLTDLDTLQTNAVEAIECSEGTSQMTKDSQQCINNLRAGIESVFTPQPTSEEERQGIIEALNKYNCGNKKGNIQYSEWKNERAIIWEISFKDKTYEWAKYDKIHDLLWISKDIPLPPKLAHRITSYFTRVKNETK